MGKSHYRHSYKHKHTSNKKRKIIIAFVGFLTLIILFLGYQYYTYYLPNFETKQQSEYIYIDASTTFDEIISQLEEKKLIKNKHSFKRWAKLKKYTQNIKTGRYEIKNEMSNKDLINNLSRKIQAPVKLKLNNIRTKEQLCKKLDNQLMADSVDFMNMLNDNNLLLEYNVKKEEIIAFFIPNTYEVYWDIKPNDLLKRMNFEFKKFWNEKRLAKADSIKLSPIEVMTLASIVEEETNLAKDKPIIAGLYLNRLRIKMPLQACPTAKYAVGDFSLRRVLYEHTQVNSPYNTYKNIGLPPGPIRTPSIESIDAVLNYKKSTYLYMCAKETFNGEHNFASTYAEHVRNAQKYQAAFKKRKK